MKKFPDYCDSAYLDANGNVKTSNNDSTKEPYPCYGGARCYKSWTYDDWHCTGCHWKGMGVSDLKQGDDGLRLKAEELRKAIEIALIPNHYD